ncbi:MAG TPA: Fur family transcriptional regulator [Candidatus Lokiarchaeia archaeon]|nr:Fur family transcriptional regulator [Candidatus Lokiarchaeia archaeon]
MPAYTQNELIELFRRSGFKVTPQRLAICEYILSRKDHPNAERILVELQKNYPAISRATIYNTLHVLKQLGLIQELSIDDGMSRYDPNTSIHVNLICHICGNVVDIKDEDLEKAWIQMIAKNRVTPEGQRLDLYYTCEDCVLKNLDSEKSS